MASLAVIISVLTIVFGFLVIKYPKIISWIIGVYLILTGSISLAVALP